MRLQGKVQGPSGTDRHLPPMTHHPHPEEPGARFPRAMEFLSSFTDYEQLVLRAPARTTFDLGRLERLLRRLGSPHERRPVLHVTGTKGKSSVTIMADAVLRAHGLRTFRFLSPHVENVRERLAVDGRPVDPDTWADLVDLLRPEVARLEREDPDDLPSFFEATAVMGFLLAARRNTQASVLEVGLGGRLDATNVVPAPAACLITNVAYDHTRILGSTLQAIAAEKAGILKGGHPAGTLLGPGHEAFAVIRRRARELACPLAHPGAGLELWDLQAGRGEDGGPRLRFNGRAGELLLRNVELRAGAEHQAWNALLAVWGAARVLEECGREAEAPACLRALSGLRLPARAEWFPGRPPVLLDGAHTRESLAALRRVVDLVAPPGPVRLVCGLTRDRDPATVLEPLLDRCADVRAVPLPSPRTHDPRVLADAAAAAGVRALVDPDPAAALQAARSQGPEGLVVVAGSLYLAGALRPRLGSRAGS